MNNNFLKGILVAAVIIYIVSPVDAVPGPVDDFVVLLLAAAARKKIR